MKSIIIKMRTRWLMLVLLGVCILALLSCAKVQALSIYANRDFDLDRKVYQQNNNISLSYMVNQEELKKTEKDNYLDNKADSRLDSKLYTKTDRDAENDTKSQEETKAEDKEVREDSKIQLNKQETSSITLMFTGDLMCLAGQQNAVNKKGEFDFTKSFTYVKSLFENADMVVGNLETLISTSNPYTYRQKIKNNNPNCNAMEQYLDALVYAGFDAVVTANNHSLDGGVIGIKETIAKLNEYNLLHTGTFSGKKEQLFILYEVKGITVAILSYTELINARDSLSSKEVDKVISCYSKEKVKRDVKAAKKAGADYIVAYNHWGRENTHEVTMIQKQHATEMAEAGVDLIIGSHPHCLQEASYITTSDSRQVLCMYSMGNFTSSMMGEINSDTIILEVNLRKNKDILYSGAIGYYPMKVLGRYKNNSFVVLPTSKQLNQDSNLSSKLKETRIRINKVIGSEISQIRY